MTKLRSAFTALAASALIVALPATSATAAVRASTAVPTSASAGYGSPAASTPWLAYAVLALTAAMAVYIGTHDEKGNFDELPISRG